MHDKSSVNKYDINRQKHEEKIIDNRADIYIKM